MTDKLLNEFNNLSKEETKNYTGGKIVWKISEIDAGATDNASAPGGWESDSKHVRDHCRTNQC